MAPVSPTSSTPMSSRFKDKLKKIRDDSAKRGQSDLQTRSDEDLQRSERTVMAFEFREKVEALIEEFVENFRAEAPGFVLNRGFFEGKYMLALRQDEAIQDDHGGEHSYFSRVMFLIDPHAQDHEIVLQCRKTLRNADLETAFNRGPMVEATLATMAAFIEEQFLGFAEGYFTDADSPKATIEG